MRRRGVRAAWRVAVVGAPLLWMAASGCGRDALVYGNLGDACFEDSQCTDGLRCVSGVCEQIDVVLPDGGVPDLSQPDMDQPDEGIPDMIDPDLPPDCDPGQTVCLDEVTIGACLDGRNFEPVDFCDRGFCEGGICIEEPLCPEGERRCSGSFTVQVCQDGRFVDEEMCPREAPCQAGQCVFQEEDLDIFVESVSVDLQRLAPGQNATVRFVLGASGRDRFQEVGCGIFLTQRRSPAPGRDVRVGSYAIEGLSAGRIDTQTLISVPRSLEAGGYQLYVFCDERDAYDERNEQNNLSLARQRVQVVDVQQEAADLEPVEVFLEADVIQQGQSVPVRAVICNNGEVTARNFQVRVEAYSLNDPDQGFFVGQSNVPVVDAGDCIDHVFNSAPLPCPGEVFEPLWLVRLAVDSTGVIPELDEGNNELEFPQPLFVECSSEMCRGDRFDFADAEQPPLISPSSYDLQLCQGDVDRFQVRLNAGDRLVGSLIRLDGGNDPLEFSIQGVANVPWEYNEFWFDALDFSTEPVPQAGPYIFTIQAADGEPEDFNYSFTYAIEGSNTQLPDLVPLSLQVERRDSANGRQVADFSFQVRNQGRLRSASATQVQVDLIQVETGEVLEQQSFTLPQLAVGQRLDFQGAFSVEDAQSYVVRVQVDAVGRVTESNEGNNTLTARLDGSMDSCDEDILEPNDSFGQAVAVEPGRYEGLRACGPDGDYYLLCPPVGTQEMQITLDFVHEQGDIDMTLFNANQRRVANANGVADTEVINYTDLRDGCYRLRVFLFGANDNSGNSYSMDINYVGEVMPPVCDDLSEPNNNFLASFPLEEVPPGQALAFCPATDVDFFRVDLSAGETFEISAAPLEMLPGEISLIVYDPSLNFVTTEAGTSPTLRFEVEEDGPHYLSLSTTSQAEVFPYTFEWLISGQP